MGALKVAVKGTEAILTTVYVDTAYRAKGIGTKLLAKAKKDFKNLQLDSHLTKDGAKFFGVKESKLERVSAILESLSRR